MSQFTRLRRRGKGYLKSLIGRDVFHFVEVSCKKELLGTKKSGWVVCTEDIAPDTLVYALGVGTDISFDLAMIERFGAEVHAFDPTQHSIEWLEAQQLPAGFHFHPYAISDKDGEATFYPPRKKTLDSFSLIEREVRTGEPVTVPVRRLKSIMAELGHSRLDILKMDIEGAEYEVLKDLLAAGIRPRQLLVEFHHRFPHIGLQPTRDAIADIRRHGYRIYHVSALGMEYSFILDRS